jgi:lipopolysaccharide/colanic/teichoic acid biosynthesis glycosyltransferase
MGLSSRTESFGKVVALLGLILLSPVFAAIAVAIKLEGMLRPSARGPVFFVEERMSRGRAFALIKFRILDRSALRSLGPGPSHIKHLELAGNEHVTLVGRFLKRYYLDELPQLFNIVKGDMALIGTRRGPGSCVKKRSPEGSPASWTCLRVYWARCRRTRATSPLREGSPWISNTSRPTRLCRYSD